MGPRSARTNSRRASQRTDWDDAQIVIDVQYTKPGTALDDYLRKEQAQAVLDLLADYVQKRSSARPSSQARAGRQPPREHPKP